MNKLIKFNVISQNYITTGNNIPFINTTQKTNIKYSVLVEVFNTDYINLFFKTFNVGNLYGLFIVNENIIFKENRIVFEYQKNGSNYYIVKIESYFFESIDYNHRHKLFNAIFFRTEKITGINFNILFEECFYDSIIYGKKISRIDKLALINEKKIESIVLFTETELEYTEKVLSLKDFTLDSNEDYISLLEVCKIIDND